MADQKTPPIVPQEYLAGVKVVDIGDIRVSRGMSRRPTSVCAHRKLMYDSRERRIWCSDCENDVEAFDAFEGVVGQFHRAATQAERRLENVEKAEQASLISRAAKAFDDIWRRQKVAPACPHCKRGILPEDAAKGLTKVSAEIERQRRGRS